MFRAGAWFGVGTESKYLCVYLDGECLGQADQERTPLNPQPATGTILVGVVAPHHLEQALAAVQKGPLQSALDPLAALQQGLRP